MAVGEIVGVQFTRIHKAISDVVIFFPRQLAVTYRFGEKKGTDNIQSTRTFINLVEKIIEDSVTIHTFYKRDSSYRFSHGTTIVFPRPP